jgi:hypothetical protein
MVAIIRAFRSAQKIVMVRSPRHPTFMGVARPFILKVGKSDSRRGPSMRQS